MKPKPNVYTSAVFVDGFSSRTNSIKNDPEFLFCRIKLGNSFTSIGARKLSRKEKPMASSELISNLSKTEIETTSTQDLRIVWKKKLTFSK